MLGMNEFVRACGLKCDLGAPLYRKMIFPSIFTFPRPVSIASGAYHPRFWRSTRDSSCSAPCGGGRSTQGRGIISGKKKSSTMMTASWYIGIKKEATHTRNLRGEPGGWLLVVLFGTSERPHAGFFSKQDYLYIRLNLFPNISPPLWFYACKWCRWEP